MAPSPSLKPERLPSNLCVHNHTSFSLRTLRRVMEPTVPSDGAPAAPAGACSRPHTLGSCKPGSPPAGVSSVAALDKDHSFLPTSMGSNGHQVGARPPAPKPHCWPILPQALQAGVHAGGISGIWWGLREARCSPLFYSPSHQRRRPGSLPQPPRSPRA